MLSNVRKAFCAEQLFRCGASSERCASSMFTCAKRRPALLSFRRHRFQRHFRESVSAVVGVLAYAPLLVPDAVRNSFPLEDTLRGVCLFAVLADDVNHCISIFPARMRFPPENRSIRRSGHHRAEGYGVAAERRGVCCHLVEDTADKLVVRYEVVDKRSL